MSRPRDRSERDDITPSLPNDADAPASTGAERSSGEERSRRAIYRRRSAAVQSALGRGDEAIGDPRFDRHVVDAGGRQNEGSEHPAATLIGRMVMRRGTAAREPGAMEVIMLRHSGQVAQAQYCDAGRSCGDCADRCKHKQRVE